MKYESFTFTFGKTETASDDIREKARLISEKYRIKKLEEEESKAKYLKALHNEREELYRERRIEKRVVELRSMRKEYRREWYGSEYVAYASFTSITEAYEEYRENDMW